MGSSVSEPASPIVAEKGSMRDTISDETAYVSDPDAYDSQASTLELPGLDSIEDDIASLKGSSASASESDSEEWVWVCCGFFPDLVWVNTNSSSRKSPSPVIPRKYQKKRSLQYLVLKSVNNYAGYFFLLYI